MKWPDKVEIVIQIIPLEPRICASFFIDPNGNFEYHCSVQLIGEPAFSALYPQNLFSESEIASRCEQLSRLLYRKSVIGYFSLFISSEGISDFNLGVNPIYPTNLLFNNLLKGIRKDDKYLTLKQEISELEQEIYLDENTNFVSYENFERKTLTRSDDFSFYETEERYYM